MCCGLIEGASGFYRGAGGSICTVTTCWEFGSCKLKEVDQEVPLVTVRTACTWAPGEEGGGGLFWSVRLQHEASTPRQDV